MATTERDDMTEQNRETPLVGAGSIEAQGLPKGVEPPGGPGQSAGDLLAERRAEGQEQDTSRPTDAEEAKAEEPPDTEPG